MTDHTDTILARLAENTDLTVYDGARKKTDPVREPPFVVVYVFTANEYRTKLNQTTTDEGWIAIVTHSAGGDRPSSDVVRRHVRTQLLDWVPDVTGCKCYIVTHEDGDPPDWDDSAGTLVMSGADRWDYRYHPAA